MRFTSKERDSETGLDYFGARYLSAAMGRFTSPGAPFADQILSSPQSWSLYSYVRNRPLTFLDRDGRGCVSPVGGGPDYTDPTVPGASCEDVAKQDKKLKASETVTGKAGSLWQYLATTTQRYVENDRELPASSRQVLTTVYRNTGVIARPFCNVGIFGYVGIRDGHLGPLHYEALGIPLDVELSEAEANISTGFILEAGKGAVAYGGEVAYTWNKGKLSGAALGFGNKDTSGLDIGVAHAGVLSDSHGNIGAYGGRGPFGIGVYGRPSLLGCGGH